MVGLAFYLTMQLLRYTEVHQMNVRSIRTCSCMAEDTDKRMEPPRRQVNL